MAIAFNFTDFTLIALLLNQILSSSTSKIDLNGLYQERIYTLKIEDQTITAYNENTYVPERDHMCEINLYSDDKLSITIQKINVERDLDIEEYGNSDFSIVRISIEDKSPWIVGKYYIKHQESSYHGFIYFNNLETKISLIKEKPPILIVNPKLIQKSAQLNGHIIQEMEEENSQILTLEDYFHSLDKKFISYNKDYHLKQLSKKGDQPRYFFESKSDLRIDFIDQFGKEYLAIISKELMDNYKATIKEGKSIRIISDIYDDDDLPVLKIKFIP